MNFSPGQHQPTPPAIQQEFFFGQNQRWRSRRAFYRPIQEPIRPEQFGVEPIGYAVAKDYVRAHHYSATFVAAIRSYGLFRKANDFTPSELVGVATFSTASNPHSIDRWTGFAYAEGAELGRFVLHDSVEGNGETYFLARALRAFKKERPNVRVILSYSDPMERKTADGIVTLPGHTGTIYAAANAIYAGRGNPKTLLLDARGRAVAQRMLCKIRNGESGRRYAEKLLREVTGIDPLPDETPAEFVRRAQEQLRPVRHKGNHLFIFPLASDRREKAAIINSAIIRAHRERALPYPKCVDRAA